MNGIMQKIYGYFSIHGFRIGVLTLIIGAGFASAVWRNADALNALEAENEACARYENWDVNRISLLKEVKVLRKKVKDAGASIYAYGDYNRYFAKMLEFGVRSRLNIENWRMEKTVFHENHVSVMTRLEVTGKAEKLLQFLDHFENGGNPVDVHSLTMAKRPQGREIRMRVNMEVLFKK